MQSESDFHVLLTNDDGHEAPGIRTMRSVLQRQGYRVSTVAPSREKS
ncbi:MAG: 5'/3'-nucleotidase SurE, partial [Xanthomonadales bacterium]|nr:5'/3'-nucleotidase SurE [Xanthomonadales bacterium]